MLLGFFRCFSHIFLQIKLYLAQISLPLNMQIQINLFYHEQNIYKFSINYLIIQKVELRDNFHQMNSNPCNFRPLSPINIQYNTSHHAHQCPHCKCSPPKNAQQIYPNTRPIIQINYHSPPKGTPKIQPSPFYSPLVPQPPKNDNSINKYRVTVHNNNNIYYNRPMNLNSSSNSSRNNTKQKVFFIKPQIRSPSPHQMIIRPPVYNRPVSPPVFRQEIINNRSDVRFISPPLVMSPIQTKNLQNIRYIGQRDQLLASNSSTFTFGQPKKPDILTKKKPGIKRLNSLNSHSSENDQIKIIKNQQNKSPVTSPRNFNYNYNQIVQQRQHISQNIEKPIQLKQKLSQKYLQLLHKKPKRYYSSSDGQTTTSNNTQLFSHNENDYNVIDPVNTTPLKTNEQENNQKQFVINKQDMEIMNKNSHLFEEEHKIAEILVQELKLNYDYFNKNQITDRSISDHVQL